MAELGSIVTMISDLVATSATVGALLACNNSSSRTASGLMSLTVSRKPLRQRFEAIGRPMRPSPIKPTFSMRFSILLLSGPGVGERPRIQQDFLADIGCLY